MSCYKSKWPLTDSPHRVTKAISIHPLSFGHTDTVSTLRLTTCPLFIVREDCGAVRVSPEILVRVEEVCPQTDGELLGGRVVGCLHPVLDTGQLLLGLVYCQPATVQSGDNNLVLIIINIDKLCSSQHL